MVFGWTQKPLPVTWGFLQVGLDKQGSTLVLTSTTYFQSAAARADGMLFPNLQKALPVVGNFSAPHESSTIINIQHYLRVDSSWLLYLLVDKFHKTHDL
jgi:hypothetical protein